MQYIFCEWSYETKERGRKEKSSFPSREDFHSSLIAWKKYEAQKMGATEAQISSALILLPAPPNSVSVHRSWRLPPIFFFTEEAINWIKNSISKWLPWKLEAPARKKREIGETNWRTILAVSQWLANIFLDHWKKVQNLFFITTCKNFISLKN